MQARIEKQLIKSHFEAFFNFWILINRNEAEIGLG